MWGVYAANGDPLLFYGTDDYGAMLWPTPYIDRHKVTFARFCKKHVEELRGKRVMLNHPLCARTVRWASWLGVKFEPGTVVI